MKWGDNSRASFYYRSREHQTCSFLAALRHAGPLEGKSVLDVGCGYGDLIPLLDGIRSYKGIDTDGEVIDQARREHPDHEFVCTDQVTKADVVFSIGTLQACEDGRKSLLSWISAARERLIVVTCNEDKLTDEKRAAGWWDGVDAEFFHGEDDFFVAVIPSAP